LEIPDNIDYDVCVNNNNANMDEDRASETRNECQGDGYLIISKKYPSISHSANTGGFSKIGEAKTVVFHHSLFVFPHELSHALVNLFDEYNFGQSTQMAASFTNCAGSNKNRCQEWQSQYPGDTKLGCFKICGYNNWYRSTQWSVMNNNPNYLNYFNPPSLEAWNQFLN